MVTLIARDSLISVSTVLSKPLSPCPAVVPTNHLPLILASTSRYRRDLLARLHLAFDIAAPGVDEAERPGEPPPIRAERLAVEKARAVAAGRTMGLVIGSDQVAALGPVILDKPGNFDRAFDQLRRARGREVIFHTAVALVNASTGASEVRLVPYTVQFRQSSDAEITRYLHTEEPYDCAASAKAEGLGISLIESMRGDDPTALIGLPLIALSAMLRHHGMLIP
jgi:septum formation protein